MKYLIAVVAPGLLSAALLTGCSSGALLAPSPAPTVTVTEEVSVSVVPQSCLDALDEADEMASIAGESMSVVVDIFEALERFDVDALNQGSEDLDAATARLEGLRYAELRDECRSES